MTSSPPKPAHRLQSRRGQHRCRGVDLGVVGWPVDGVEEVPPGGAAVEEVEGAALAAGPPPTLGSRFRRWRDAVGSDVAHALFDGTPIAQPGPPPGVGHFSPEGEVSGESPASIEPLRD